jgi:long-chain acyl-CoA synthetase
MTEYPHASYEEMCELARQGMTLSGYASHTPGRMAVIGSNGNRTFSALNARANQLVRSWRQAGIKAGDSVALLMGNRPAFVEVYKAALRSGVRLTPINWHLSGEEVLYVVDNCEARAFITEDSYLSAANYVIQRADLTSALMLGDGPAPAGFEDYETALDAQDSADIDDPEIGRYMLYTSGTTGRPKGVWRRTRPAILPNWIEGAAPMRPLSDACLLTGPAYHAAPLMSIVRALVSGVPIVMMDKWDAGETLRLIDEHGVTHSHMVATMFHRLLQLPEEVRDEFRHRCADYLWKVSNSIGPGSDYTE